MAEFNVRQLVKRERHAVVFDAMCKALGKSHEQVASEILTQAIIRETPAYREATGQGGATKRFIPD